MSRPPQRQPAARPAAAGSLAPRFGIHGSSFEAPPLPAGLYVVATPIGNLADVTIRALSTLAGAAAILAEDTRVTRVLLSHYGIATPLYSYHEHSGELPRGKALERIRVGEAVALVSDAGTPLVSDPGYRLVEAVLAEGFAVVPVPGASAILAGLVAAGLPTDRFFFEGFLPARPAARRGRLSELAQVPGTLVLYEAPHRIAECLADAASVLGDRPAAVARELTKLYETVRRGSLAHLAALYGAEAAPRGEIVLLIGAASPEAVRSEIEASLDDKLRAALSRHTVKDAAALVAGETGLARRAVYARALALARGGPA